MGVTNVKKTTGLGVLLVLLLLAANVYGAESEQLLRHSKFVRNDYTAGDFKLVVDGQVADFFVDEDDLQGVARALEDLSNDIEMVTGRKPAINSSLPELNRETVIAGTIGHSQVIDDLIKAGKLDTDGITGMWESYVIQVVSNPLPNVDTGLVIAGSDRRGTIYGIYEVSRQIGVSPWYWWADAAPEKQDSLVVQNGVYKQGEPSVRYRGIFLNNEAPSLSTWVQRFGGFNHQFYEKVFELVLRLRANYLWPAMWSPKSFFRDDWLNPQLAHEYGVVIGTSHHEPMMRAWGEWGRFGSGEWNYSTNKENLLRFWEDGIEWSKDYEKIVTVGMRGDGDEPMMHEGTIDEMITTMESIISDQRKILADKLNPNVTQVPQVWALYKEVQDLYENGLEVPEDVTILLANDNFANIRMLPMGEERNHPGGFGMYYHFDYVGGPKSYRWVNAVSNQKIWEQMSMAYDYGVDRIWIVNVGDLKPHEIAIEFFLDMAYDIDKWDKDNLDQFSLQWAEREFGSEYAAEIAEITDTYRKFTGRKKSEDVNPGTYSLLNYKEAERVLAEFEEISVRAEQIYELICEDKKDAFYQLVLYPTRASKNVVKLNIYAGLNNLYVEQGRASANLYADLAEQVFRDEASDTKYYNNSLAGGKWRGIMSNAHIGQTGWETSQRNIMPQVRRIPVVSGSEMGIAVEGDRNAYTQPDSIVKTLPVFSVFAKERHYIDIFNMKSDPFQVKVAASEPWIVVTQEDEVINQQSRVWVEIDWEQAPKGERLIGELEIKGTGKMIAVEVNVYNPDQAAFNDLDAMTFIESNGYVSIEAEHYSNKVAVDGLSWQKIDNYGRTLSSMAVFPRYTSYRIPPNAPYLEYQVYISNPGHAAVTVYTAPTNNINRQRGLCYGIAFDEQRIQVVDTFPKENDAFYTSPLWSRGVMDNIRITTTRHQLDAGVHTLRFYMVDSGVVLQKIVIDTGGVKPSYLGPPESYYVGKIPGTEKDGYLQLLTAVDYGNYLVFNTPIGLNHGYTSQENLDALHIELLEAPLVLSNRKAGIQERLSMLKQVQVATNKFKSRVIYKEGYEELANLLDEARAFVATARTGDKHEEYPLEAKLDLQDVIRAASALLRNELSTTDERIAMLNTLVDELKTFKNSIYIDPNHRLLEPEADAFVRGGGYSSNNYGSSANLEVKWERENESMTRVAFLKFDISNFATIERAILNLYVEFSDQLENRVIAFYDATGAEWSEDDLTWENAPLTDGTYITSRNVSDESGLWYEINLTQMVKNHVEQGHDEIIIRIENRTSHWAGLVRFTSKEGRENTPELSVIGLSKQ
ncbi:MAG: DNRLRE domain-containing protein [Firmicutes bacterium]|nr:DNRLRE domain-containing protein [Bacillota bacterium]